MVSVDFLEEIVKLREECKKPKFEENLAKALEKVSQQSERDLRLFEPTTEQLRQAYSL